MKKKLLNGVAVVFFIVLSIMGYFYFENKKIKNHSAISLLLQKEWTAPDTNLIAHNEEGNLIRYGRELIVHTANYFGPKGTVAQITNGMNCGNCHIEAGTIILGNDFSRVAANYPIYRNRSSKVETVEMRVNDCFERSMNGESPGDSSKEMKAIVAYLKWVGKDVPKDANTTNSSTEKLPFMNRAADTIKGKVVYKNMCQSCHGENGEGKLNENSQEYLYPPLWGNHSYNIGAGICQLSKLSGYIKNNMPIEATYKNPQLTNEQAWDVAAFVNSKPRPYFKDLKMDWQNISTKPVDYPFGPYTDSFSEIQHKYGPFKPIMLAYEKMKKK